MIEPEELARERDFYRDRVDALGARLFHAAEELGFARRDKQRARTAAVLAREAYAAGARSEGLEEVTDAFLATTLHRLSGDAVALLGHDEAGAAGLELLAGLGLPEGRAPLSLESAPPAFDLRSSEAPPSAGLSGVDDWLGQPFWLWCYDPEARLVLVVGRADEDRRLRPPFEAGDRELVEAALHVYRDLRQTKQAQLRLAALNGQLRALVEAFARFVPKDFLENLERASIAEVEAGDQVEVEKTVLFSDIRGFTSISEARTAKELFSLLNAYLATVAPCIRDNGGFIDKYIGDAVMALFDRPRDAVAASAAMIAALERFNEGRARPLEIGIGLHTGSLILGTLGDAKSMQCTVISDAVNLASRLEGLTKDFEAKVLISGAVLTRLPAAAVPAHRFCGRVRVKGKSEAVEVYELTAALEPARRASLERAAPMFACFFEALEDGRLEDAARSLRGALGEVPGDAVAELHAAELAARLAAPAPSWDGVLDRGAK
jgi:class 3 adenylate cyclase